MAGKIRISEFPNCCGIFVLNNFYKFPPYSLEKYQKEVDCRCTNQDIVDIFNTSRGYSDYSDEKYFNRLREEIKYYKDTYNLRKSFLLAVINVDEASIEDLLLDEGFEVLVDWVRNPTGTKIKTFIYHLLPKEPKPVESIISKTLNTGNTVNISITV